MIGSPEGAPHEAYAPDRRSLLSSPPQSIDIVVVSFESRDYLDRCLDAWTADAFRPLVVDNGSTDGSAEAARARGADVLQLPENRGFAAAANAGIKVGTSPFVLVSNADAWPEDAAAVHRLVACAAADGRIGAVAPALVGIDSAPQPTLLPEPSRWWTGRPAVTSFPERRRRTRRRALAHRRLFLVGAVILFRRAALDEVGGWDESFFLFNEEVDLCRRLTAAGWRLQACDDALFVHAGGVSTRPRWDTAYREQLRGHLRMIDKYEGREAAEQARRWLSAALRLRGLVSSGEQRRWLGASARWLRARSVEQLLAEKPAIETDRSPSSDGRSRTRRRRPSR